MVVLAQAFGVAAAAISLMIVRLTERGFITRDVDLNEARAHFVRREDTGEELLTEIHEFRRNVDPGSDRLLATSGAAH
jgi:DNA-binding MarR family transcriptional regulator